MSDHKEHIIHYSAADIQRYVQGKLSANEMHAIEKAALDDPFLADAIEGMQQALEEHDEKVITDQLQQLQQALQTRTADTNKKTVPVVRFRWWQAAAAAVVLIISGVWIYTLVTSPSETSAQKQVVVAKTEEPKQPEGAAAPGLIDTQKAAVPADSVQAQETYANASRAGTSKKDTKDITSVSRSSQPARNTAPLLKQQQKDTVVQPYADGTQVAKAETKQAPEKQEAAAAARAPEANFGAARKAADVPAAKERETELITIARNDSPAKRMVAADKNLSGVIKGRVIDQNNNPIANAYLQILNNNNNFITDKTGFFKIPVSDSVVDVAVNVAGYGTQNFRLQNNASMNHLQLQPANVALDEVTVTSIGTKKGYDHRKKYPSVMQYDAEPVFGWVAFDQYLEKNKNRPADNANIAGNVIVSFEVNKKGELSDFKVEQSLAKAYDDEAIRLIKEGPAWKLLKGRKARVTVIVKF